MRRRPAMVLAIVAAVIMATTYINMLREDPRHREGPRSVIEREEVIHPVAADGEAGVDAYNAVDTSQATNQQALPITASQAIVRTRTTTATTAAAAAARNGPIQILVWATAPWITIGSSGYIDTPLGRCIVTYNRSDYASADVSDLQDLCSSE